MSNCLEIDDFRLWQFKKAEKKKEGLVFYLVSYAATETNKITKICYHLPRVHKHYYIIVILHWQKEKLF